MNLFRKRAIAPSIFYNQFLDQNGNEINPEDYITVIADGNNFAPTIQHKNLVFINPKVNLNEVADGNIVLDNDYVLWFMDKKNNRLWRKDNKEIEYDSTNLIGLVEYIYDLGNDNVKIL